MTEWNSVISTISMVVGALGGIMVAWGLIQLGIGLKDHASPQITQGIGMSLGGVLIAVAAYMIGQQTLSIPTGSIFLPLQMISLLF